jgi:hypothetical protein
MAGTASGNEAQELARKYRSTGKSMTKHFVLQPITVLSY